MRTNIAAAAILLALAAACSPHDGAAYAQAPRSDAAVSTVAAQHPQPAHDAVADGHVHEYH